MENVSPIPTSQRQWIREAVEAHQHRLLRYAAHILGDPHRARDVVQDTFFQLLKQSADEIRPRLAEWLFTVCRNRALDVLRKEKRMRTGTEEAALRVSEDAPQAAAAERRDTAEQVDRMMGRLSENQQEVIRLKFQSGLSYKEISRITQLSVSNVGYLIHTALRKLRKELEVECG